MEWVVAISLADGTSTGSSALRSCCSASSVTSRMFSGLLMMPMTFLTCFAPLGWLAMALAAAAAVAAALSVLLAAGATICCVDFLLVGTSLCAPGATTLPLLSTGVSMMAFGPGTVGPSDTGTASTTIGGTSGEVAAGGDSASVGEAPHSAPATRMAAIP